MSQGQRESCIGRVGHWGVDVKVLRSVRSSAARSALTDGRARRILACGLAALSFLGCGEDEPLAEQVCIEIEAIRTARGHPACAGAKCMVKRTRQSFTAAICAASAEDAHRLTSHDRTWNAVAQNEVERACLTFSCPDPNPCTLDGRRCNIQPSRARFDGRGEPSCSDTGSTKGCEEGETMWRCTRLGDVQGGKVCGCLDAAQRAAES